MRYPAVQQVAANSRCYRRKIFLLLLLLFLFTFLPSLLWSGSWSNSLPLVVWPSFNWSRNQQISRPDKLPYFLPRSPQAIETLQTIPPLVVLQRNRTKQNRREERETSAWHFARICKSPLLLVSLELNPTFRTTCDVLDSCFALTNICPTKTKAIQIK